MAEPFLSPEALAESLAARVAEALKARLAGGGQAALAVSGGSTPLKFFRALSRQELDWQRVIVTLVDERCVPEHAPRSNAGLVRAHLLQNHAAQARFLPLAHATEADIAALPLPFAAIVLGMGKDGHTASLFPRGDHLAAALAGPHLIETMTAPGVPEPRVTLTLPVILQADLLVLHIEGAEKEAALRRALEPGPETEMPVRAVLRARPEVEIYRCM